MILYSSLGERASNKKKVRESGFQPTPIQVTVNKDIKIPRADTLFRQNHSATRLQRDSAFKKVGFNRMRD